MTKEEIVSNLNGITFEFQNQPARIGQRKTVKPKQGILYCFFSQNEKPFRNISSLYFTRDSDKLAFEYQKKYYLLNVNTLKVSLDTQGFYQDSKSIPQSLQEALQHA